MEELQKVITADVVASYEDSLNRHIDYVIEAGLNLGLSKAQLLKHDISKFYPEEFIPYLKKFKLGIKDRDEFGLAWLHHIHNNPHHFQHWIIPGKENAVLEMPENYCLEMIADWVGASKEYSGTSDMSMWLSKNFKNIILHEKSKSFVIKILEELGYKDFY